MFINLDKPAPFGQIRWARDAKAISILDQTRLSAEVVEVEIDTVGALEEAIKSLRVRGAPLIGVSAAMGLAACVNREADSIKAAEELWEFARSAARRLAVARPTAVNLSWAMRRMEEQLAAPLSGTAGLIEALMNEANLILEEDVAMCRDIGEHGAALLPESPRILTHCNAGALATAGIGTALAPVYVAAQQGSRPVVFANETRPLLQGSRITAWELDTAGIDVTVLTDGMAAALMATNPPDLVFVGADRVAANGDIANKIGTYGLAVLAHHHSIPFYVLAPSSTIDLATPDGGGIEIENRPDDEVRRGFGRATAPDSVAVWNPAFDVTPAHLVTGIVTEKGLVGPPYGSSLRTLGGTT